MKTWAPVDFGGEGKAPWRQPAGHRR